MAEWDHRVTDVSLLGNGVRKIESEYQLPWPFSDAKVELRNMEKSDLM